MTVKFFACLHAGRFFMSSYFERFGAIPSSILPAGKEGKTKTSTMLLTAL